MKELRELDARAQVLAFGWVWAKRTIALPESPPDLTALVPPHFLDRKGPNGKAIWVRSNEEAPRYYGWGWEGVSICDGRRLPHYTTNMSDAYKLMQRVNELWGERGYTDLKEHKQQPYWHIVGSPKMSAAWPDDSPTTWSAQIRACDASDTWPVIVVRNETMATAVTRVAINALEALDGFPGLIEDRRQMWFG